MRFSGFDFFDFLKIPKNAHLLPRLGQSRKHTLCASFRILENPEKRTFTPPPYHLDLYPPPYGQSGGGGNAPCSVNFILSSEYGACAIFGKNKVEGVMRHIR